MTGQARRIELAAFLRSRRARLAPEDVGLRSNGRRRTPGLRREELASLAGIGLTWYTRLEQGHAVNASTQVLDAIATTLRLDSTEWRHLYQLANIPGSDARRAGVLTLDPTVQAVLDALALPAAVYSERYDLLAWNSRYAALFPRLVATPPPRRNVLWDVFTADSSPWLNRADGLPRMVATLRTAFGRHIGDPDWIVWIDELSRHSEEFARMWGSREVAGLGSHTKVFRHATVGELTMVTASFPVGDDEAARMVVYTPLDQQTRDRMTRLPHAEAGCPARR